MKSDDKSEDFTTRFNRLVVARKEAKLTKLKEERQEGRMVEIKSVTNDFHKVVIYIKQLCTNHPEIWERFKENIHEVTDLYVQRYGADKIGHTCKLFAPSTVMDEAGTLRRGYILGIQFGTAATLVEKSDADIHTFLLELDAADQPIDFFEYAHRKAH